MTVTSSVKGLVVPTSVTSNDPTQTARSIESRDVYSPKILTPTTGTVWHANAIGEVTWDTSNPPAHITNPNGTILLGFLNSTGENLDINHPLASYVNLALGKAEIRVPNVPTGTNYTVVLMGDSGNCSPMFTIESGSVASSSSSSPSPSTTSTAPST